MINEKGIEKFVVIFKNIKMFYQIRFYYSPV